MDSIDENEAIIKTAYKRWETPFGQKMFKKWFGELSAADNNRVKLRYKHAMDVMYADKRIWSIMCCTHQMKGACKFCGKVPRIIAFTSFEKSTLGRIDSNTNIRFCPLAFKMKHKHYQQGMTMFHEIMHMTSSAKDKGYAKIECINNAIRNPQRARHNAAAYVYFARELGSSRKHYLENTGPPAISPTCGDKWNSCAKLIGKGKCCH